MTGRKSLSQTRIRPSLEILEDRLAAGNLLPFLSFMLPPHSHSSAQEHSEAAEVAPYRLVSMNAAEQTGESVVQNEAWSPGEDVFTVLAAQPHSLSENSRFVANTPDPFAPEDAKGLQPVSQEDTDSLLNPGKAAKNAEQVLSTPPNNSANNAPPNLAGAYAGAGQGPGGVSTPNPSGGGGSSGGGSANLHLPSLTQVQQMLSGANANTPAMGAAVVANAAHTATTALNVPAGNGNASGSGTSTNRELTTAAQGTVLPQKPGVSATPSTAMPAPTPAATARAAGIPIRSASNAPAIQSQIPSTIPAGSNPTNLLWYNGDFDFNNPNANALSNEEDASVSQSSVYDDFIVPAGPGWDINTVFSNNLMSLNVINVTEAAYSIRSDVSLGNGGTLVASGTAPATVTDTGQSGGGEYTVTVTTPLNIHLAPGTYWLNVTPIDDNPSDYGEQSFLCTTTGANAVGQPAGNDGNSYWDSSYWGKNFGSPSDGLGPGTWDFSEGLGITTSPVVTNPGNQSNAEGASVSLPIQASGGSGSLSYGASGLPAGLTINSSTGLISGMLDYSDAETQGGQYSVTVTAYDSNGHSGSTTFTWTVANTDTPPTLDNPGDQINWQGDAVALQLSASDPDGDTLSYAASGLPNGLTINSATGLISGVLAAPDSGTYNVTVSAADANNTVRQSFTWTVTTVQIDPIADQTNLIGDDVSVAVNAFDQSGQALTYNATGLPPGLSINSATGLISGTIANTASVTTPYNVTVTASDGTDSANTSFAWNISNFTLDNPGDRTNAEGDAVALQPTIESNGNPALTFSATGLPYGLSINPNTGLIAGTIANLDSNNSPYSVTISATDGTSTSSQTFTWTITHVLLTDPGNQINAPGDTVALQIQASDPDNDSLSYTATGLPPGLSINMTTGLISGTIDSTDGSDTPYSVTVTASDGAHTATDTFSWTVANQAITVTNPGTQNNAEGDNVSLQINASDPSGNGFSYTATGLPAGLQIDYASGLISGTIDNSAAKTNGGVYRVTVLADDGQGNNGCTTFTWNVSHTNQAPTLDNPGDQVNKTGDVVSLPLSGSDDDGDTVSYIATGLPPGLSINSSSGVISGTLPATAASSTPYSVTVKASDGTLTASQTFNWSVTKSVVTLTNPGDQTNSEGNSVSLQLSASDANNSTLTYQASGLPPGLSITSTGLISGTVSSGDAADSPYTVTVTATDAQGYSSAQQFLWNINAANLNPVVTNPGPQINTQGDVLSLPIRATDPAGNGLSYSATGLPPNLTINASSGLISGVLSSTSAAGSPYTVTVTATDGNYSGSATFTWSVTNQAVTVTNPGTQSNSGGDAVSLQINASDPAQLPLTYAAVGLPEGLNINSSTGLISGTIASSAGGTFSVTVMASDSQGKSGSATFTWNVRYVNQPPTLDNPGDQLNKTGDAVSVPLSGSDVDGDTVTYSAMGLPPGLSVDPTTGLLSGTLPASAASSTPYSVTVTASDGTLYASQTFNWFVTADVVTLTNPGDQTNTEGDSVSLQLSASDANNSTLTYQASGLPSGLSINASTGLISGTVSAGDSANGPYSVTVTATDSQGYSSYQQFTWTINAPTNALSLTNPGNQSNAEGDNVSLQIQANDPDGDTLEYAASGLPIGLSIDPTSGLISGTVDYSAAEMSGGQYNVTVTVSDGNGQTVSRSFVWTIADTPQPPWLNYPEFQDSQTGTAASLQLVGGSPDGDALSYSASGLPSGLSVDSSTGLISGTISASAGSYTVTATVTDTVNNLSASQTFTWQVTSGPAPQVLLSFDGQPVGEDYLAGVDPATPISVTVTLEGATPGLHSIQISIPSGESQVDQPSFQLPNGGSKTIKLTPEKESQSFDDVLVRADVDGEEAGDGKGTNTLVNIGATSGGHIRNADTPAGMADRIPPSVVTPVTITQSNLSGDETIAYVVEGGANAGEASLSKQVRKSFLTVDFAHGSLSTEGDFHERTEPNSWATAAVAASTKANCRCSCVSSHLGHPRL